jgi:hypothetical protein
MTITDWIREQGNAGAVSNARRLRDQLRLEERQVRALADRLGPDEREPQPAASPEAA